MNTAGRKKRHTETESNQEFEESLIKNLIDESKYYEVENSTNAWDKSVKIASFLTRKYVQEMKKWDRDYCRDNDFICNAIL